jgi:hypothetical protein
LISAGGERNSILHEIDPCGPLGSVVEKPAEEVSRSASDLEYSKSGRLKLRAVKLIEQRPLQFLHA